MNRRTFLRLAAAAVAMSGTLLSMPLDEVVPTLENYYFWLGEAGIEVK